MPFEGGSQAGLWRRVDELVDRAPNDDALRSHRLEVVAARRFRALGRPVPEDFAAASTMAGIATLTAPLLLDRVRDAYDGPTIVLKGPEVAAVYPDSTLRGFGDVDILVPDAAAAHATLLEAGFQLVGDPELYIDIHHLRPVATNGIPLHLEIHSRPKWLDGVPGPPIDELFAAAVPGATGVEGLLALPPAHHALVLAVHSWSHEPLRRLRDLIDIAAMSRRADRAEILELARRWRVGRLWRTTIAVVDAVFDDRRNPWALRLWAQNLGRVRERTVLENHLQRWLSDFWALPAGTAMSHLPQTILAEVRPEGEEGWRKKLSRSALAVRNAARPRSSHDQELDERASRPRS